MINTDPHLSPLLHVGYNYERLVKYTSPVSFALLVCLLNQLPVSK